MAGYFKLIGEMTIPDEKKAEFNTYALKLLDACGVRWIKEIEVGGKTIEVVSHPKINGRGLVVFNYSVFEKKKKELSYYDPETCRLNIDECGFDELGVAVMLLMTLQESFSETKCYLFWDGEIVSVNNRGLAIENGLGIKLRFPHRADLWETLLFFREHQKEIGMSFDSVLFSVPEYFEEVDSDVLIDVLYTIEDSYFRDKLKRVSYTRSQFTEENNSKRDNYLYSAFLSLLETGAEVESFLRRLIKLPLDERKKEAEDTSCYGDIADLSQYLTAQTLVRTYCAASSKDFWDVWDSISDEGYYRDYNSYKKKKDYSKNRPNLLFHEAIQRDSDDELIGVWKDRDLELSEDMLDAMKEWGRIYNGISVPEGFDTVKYLLEVITDLENDWDMKYLDEEVIKVFTDNADNKDFHKALMLIRHVMERYVDQFPELTRRQALDWVISRGRTDFDSIELGALLGLMTDKTLREKTLGF